MKTIFEDERPIRSVFWPTPDGANITVGSNGIEKIVPYYESGQMGDVVWLAVYIEGQVSQRINIAHIDLITHEVNNPD